MTDVSTSPTDTGLREIRAVDALTDESSERATRIVAIALDVPMAFLSLIDQDRQIVRRCVGWPAKFASRRVLPLTFGSWGHTSPDGEPLFVEKITADRLLKSNPAINELGGVSYAGISLMTRKGVRVGTLCVLDTKAREWTKEDGKVLKLIAAQIMSEIELRTELVQREQVEGRLLHNTLHDSLTALPNRTLFSERLGHAIQRAKRRPEYKYAVLFLDLDRFKIVNDSLGHHAGDQLLIAVAKRLSQALREIDTVARLGGDEFAILLEELADLRDASRVAERIHGDMIRAFDIAGNEIFTSVSIGIVLSSSGHDAPELLLRSADMAMYRAKDAGRSRYEMFDREMHTEALDRLQRETDLRKAVEREEFILHYQPVISLPDGRISGVEALIRWNHPTRGRVPPIEFISIAEDMGLIIPIGQWVLEEACRQVRIWHMMPGGDPELTVGVNVSAKQFQQPDLVQKIANAIQATGFPSHLLKLEMTESVIIDNTESATRTLAELKSLGVQIHMDDFGTGYSSLSYLHRLPIDAMKIDRSFVSQMDTDQRQMQLVQTILLLAANLGVATVGEGVENVAQLALLRKLACNYGQGYLFSKPLEPAAMAALLREGRRW
jgi:diguanylate cyclase (GGDEF)-like protein